MGLREIRLRRELKRQSVLASRARAEERLAAVRTSTQRQRERIATARLAGIPKGPSKTQRVSNVLKIIGRGVSRVTAPPRRTSRGSRKGPRSISDIDIGLGNMFK